jgi:hypothetical protein
MIPLKHVAQLTEEIDDLSEILEALEKLDRAETHWEVAEAESQIIAVLAVISASASTLRQLMSDVRLGLSMSGQTWKWDAIARAATAVAEILGTDSEDDYADDEVLQGKESCANPPCGNDDIIVEWDFDAFLQKLGDRFTTLYIEDDDEDDDDDMFFG